MDSKRTKAEIVEELEDMRTRYRDMIKQKMEAEIAREIYKEKLEKTAKELEQMKKTARMKYRRGDVLKWNSDYNAEVVDIVRDEFYEIRLCAKGWDRRAHHGETQYCAPSMLYSQEIVKLAKTANT